MHHVSEIAIKCGECDLTNDFISKTCGTNELQLMCTTLMESSFYCGLTEPGKHNGKRTCASCQAKCLSSSKDLMIVGFTDLSGPFRTFISEF